MLRVQIKSHTGKPIQSFIDWAKYGLPPERALQWKKGRSAFELGCSWTADGEPTVPAELVQLFGSHDALRGTVILSGIVEHETVLPYGKRGARCHDLALRAEQDDKVVTICIEAKADESFGGTVAEELTQARKRPGTKFPERLHWLTQSLLGLPAFRDNRFSVLSDLVSGLPYQLLSAIGGTLLEAELQGASKAVFLVHEFRTPATLEAKMDANTKALNCFLRLLLSANRVGPMHPEIRSGQLVGPILITERPVAETSKMSSRIPLFIGKIRSDRMG
jgi:hypothetical protein